MKTRLAGHGVDDFLRQWPLSLGLLLSVSLFLFSFSQPSLSLSTLSLSTGYLHHRMLKEFLIWLKEDLGPWGPLVLLNMVDSFKFSRNIFCALESSMFTPFKIHVFQEFAPFFNPKGQVLTTCSLQFLQGCCLYSSYSSCSPSFDTYHFILGGGYLFGLPVGFVADSIGATIGATAALFIGRTIGRPYVISKLKNYPQFQAVAVAIQRSGFKIVLLLRLTPLLPFNMLNYLLSVTPVGIGEYMLATWFGMMPITFALVYVGTTLKDLSDLTHGWSEVSKARWACLSLGLGISVILIVCIAKVSKASLDKALAENGDLEGAIASQLLPIVAEIPSDIQKPLIIKIDPAVENHEK
ncbi:SNARE associated Golgi protein [Dillenia turbinata]|uniref:SNARE associated Golgi protein n=1 Tax=Dillenia turbinata TaxID=194707 RepID=A0AAN8ZNJ4_9MAGN